MQINCLDEDGLISIDYDEKFFFTHPKGGPKDLDHRCTINEIERIDQHGFLVHTACRYAKV